MYVRTLAVATVLAAVAASAAACSSSSTPSAAATPATASSGSPAPGSSGPATAAGTSSPDPSTTATSGDATPIQLCNTLPTAQAASLSGKTLTSSREQDSAYGDAFTCDYYTCSGVGGFSVTVTAPGGASAYGNSLQTDTVEGPTEQVMPLDGIGDKAFSAHDGVRVLFGDRMIYVAGVTSVPTAEAIIRALEAKLT